MTKRNAFQHLLICLGWLIIANNLAQGSVRADSSVPFKLIKNYLIVVAVEVNGEGTFNFLLDTGTNTTLIIPELSRRLNLRPTDRIELITVGGSQIVPRSQLHSLTIGSKSVNNVEVLSADLPEIRQLDSSISGVIGQNFLSQFNYILDYRNRRIEFEEGDEIETRLSGARLSIKRDEGKCIVLMPPISDSKSARRLVLDTALSGLVLFASNARIPDLEIEHSPHSLISISTNAGNDTARLGVIRTLRIGDETFRDLPVALIQNPIAIGDRPEDGLLPACLFRTIYFNNKKNYVIFNPRFSN
jgi:predicted aspartyl protease